MPRTLEPDVCRLQSGASTGCGGRGGCGAVVVVVVAVGVCVFYC